MRAHHSSWLKCPLSDLLLHLVSKHIYMYVEQSFSAIYVINCPMNSVKIINVAIVKSQHRNLFAFCDFV